MPLTSIAAALEDGCPGTMREPPPAGDGIARGIGGIAGGGGRDTPGEGGASSAPARGGGSGIDGARPGEGKGGRRPVASSPGARSGGGFGGLGPPCGPGP